MNVSIRLFATLKDLVGQPRITLELPEDATVATLLDHLTSSYPPLTAARNNILVAINKNYAFPETIIEPDDEIALFPPVSGGAIDNTPGSFPHPVYFSLSETAPDLNEIHARLVQPDVGAVISFTGAVRGATKRDGLPPATLYLEYEAYAAMAEEKMAQIAREIWEKWPLVKGIAIVQRIGKLAIGETTTLVACAAGHRDQGAFDAARYGIDRLKEIVPVWKKEVGEDHAVWVEGDYHPSADDNR